MNSDVDLHPAVITFHSRPQQEVGFSGGIPFFSFPSKSSLSHLPLSFPAFQNPSQNKSRTLPQAKSKFHSLSSLIPSMCFKNVSLSNEDVAPF